MIYSLYIDKSQNFECDIFVKNSTLKNAKARLVIKSESVNLLFEGSFNSNNNKHCIIPISKMKGLLNENTGGEMYLEVIVDDMYFIPWKSNFIVKEYNSVNALIKEQKQIKNTVTDKNSKKIIKEYQDPVESDRIWYLLTKMGITKRNVYKKKNEIKHIIKEYFSHDLDLIYKNKTNINNALLMLT